MSEHNLHDDWPASALQAADKAFMYLTVESEPLTLDCAALTAASIAASGTTAGTAASGTTAGSAGSGTTAEDAGTAAAGSADTTAGSAGAAALSGIDLGPPAGEVPLPVLRDWLMAHPSAYTARDAVWRELIRRARLGKPEWVIAAVGMAMPALVAMAGTLAAGYRGEPADIDSEILTGFLEGLRGGVDPARDAPHASLCFAAWRAGRDLRLAQQEYLLVNDIEHAAAESSLPCHPYGHVDLLVYRAEALGLIDGEDVEPYIAIRLGHQTPELVAEDLGIDLDVLRMRMTRADTRLAWAVGVGVLTGTFSADLRDELAKRHGRRTRIRAGKAAAASRAASRRSRVNPAAAAA